MKGEINDEKYIVTEMLEANKSLPLPLRIKEGVKDAFQCKICHETPTKPTIIATKCCHSLLGCEECVNIWYADGIHSLSKTCNRCNEPRAYAIAFQFIGLHDFITGIRKFLRSEEDDQLSE